MSPLQPLRRKRPRWGCVVLSALAVPCLAAGFGFFVATLTTTEAMPRDPAMESFETEARHATERGFVLADQHDFEHTEDGAADTFPLALGADECVAVIAVTWGHQYGARLRIREGERVLSEYADPEGRVLHAQWCSPAAPQTVTVELERHGGDVWGREGQSEGLSHFGVYRAPAAAVGGIAAVDRGVIPDAVLASRPEVWAAAERAAPPGRRLAPPIRVEAFAARLIPEDGATYAELHRGAKNREDVEVDPRLTPLPDTVPATWRPGPAHTRQALRAALAPEEHPDESHPASRQTSEGFSRVLAVIDADRLGVRCAELQLVRMRYGFGVQVSRAPAGEVELTRLEHSENLATDRLCAGQGTVVYVTPLTDRAPYTLRLYEG